MEKRKLRSAVLSDTGRQRTENEDLVVHEEELGLYAVIDGVGGENAGEKAARIAADILIARMRRATGSIGQRLKEAITLANNEIFQQARANPAFEGMACVMTVAAVDGERLTLGQVGDSRLYMVHNGAIRKISRDHSLVGQLEEMGQLSELDAMRHPRRHEIMRDVGSEQRELTDDHFVDVTELRFDRDAALLLCSDGLSDMITSEAMRAIVVASAGNPREAAHRLVEAANLAGGKDNVSVVVVEGEDFAARVRPGYVAKEEKAAPARAAAPPPPLPGAYAKAAKPGIGSLLRSAAIGLALVGFGFALSKPWPWWAVQAGPGVLRVAAAGADYPTIAAALAAAAPGDVVELAPGTYAESVVLPAGVTLRSQRSRQAILRPPAGQPGLRAEASRGGRVEGLRFELDPADAGGVGLRLRDAEVWVEDVEVVGAGFAAIESLGEDRSRIHGAELRDNPGHALRAADHAEPAVESTLFSGNGLSALGSAASAAVATAGKAQVLVVGAARPRLLHNRFHRGGGPALQGASAAQEQRFRDWNLIEGVVGGSR